MLSFLFFISLHVQEAFLMFVSIHSEFFVLYQGLMIEAVNVDNLILLLLSFLCHSGPG